MDQDQIETQVGELAQRFGVQAPQVELGNAPDWCVDGVHPRLTVEQFVLVIGPRYDELSPLQQRGALAEAIVSADLQRAGRFAPVIAALMLLGVLHPAMSYLAEYATGLGILPEILWWQVLALVLVTYGVSAVAIHVFWSRRIIYRLDRRMADVLGAEMVSSMLDLDERSRRRARGLKGITLKFLWPSKTRRERRIESGRRDD
ncbi:hypothetical protein [Nocardia sp. NPDC058114]|uniref:hypothetical protein n=1 Tax=Nocardia sp. NPDC058114 TaxID=3346346 RepID=UPI0036DC87EC